jgi:hypothetical protein
VEGQNQFLTSKGYWFVAARISPESSKIEGFASPDELAPIIPYLPETAVRDTEKKMSQVLVSKVGDIPIDVTAPMVKRVAQVELGINSFLRKHTRALDGLHKMLAHNDELVQWKLEDVLPKAFGITPSELSVPGRLAIDRFMAQNDNGVKCWLLAVKTVGFWVRSKQDMRAKGQVMNWARMYQESASKAALGKDVKEELRKNPLSAFINKAHRLILRSRKIRSPTTIGLLGPSAESGNGGVIHAVDTGEALTENDKLIMRFLFETSQMAPALVPDNASSICSLIYRAVGAYTNLSLGTKVARLLLQELGVMSPWSDRLINQYGLRLPGLGLWPYQERMLAKAEASCKDLSVFRDSAEQIRKDWGQMPVYCIDNHEAMEIDDGISVESDTNMPGWAWLHVHTANPAAYLSRDHPIAVVAADVLSSTYTPSRKFSMMPPAFAQNICSLGADRPAITVSTLIRPDGSVADIKMSLGIVRNVVRLTHSAVGDALEEIKREKATMVIGGVRPAQENDGRDSEALKQSLPELHLMRRILKQRFQRRLNDWPEEEKIKRNTAVIRSDVWTSLSEEPVPLSADKNSHWKGDPIIEVSGDRFPRVHDNFDFTPLVEHAMLLAGESVAKWCKDRKIPTLYHAATPHPLFPVSKLNQLEDTDFRLEPSGRISPRPEPHWALNMRQYMRITSPIRRYPDLVNQWQIQAYLEANSHGEQDSQDVHSPQSLSKLPFTGQEMDGMVATLNATLSRLKQTASLAEQHWIHQAFFRAFHFQEAELPEVWDMKVIGPDKREVRDIHESTGILGYISPFHAIALLVSSDKDWEKEVKRGQYLPVKIEVVDAELDKIIVRAVGPPSDNPITTQPIHIRSSEKPVSPNKNSPETQQR